MWRTIFYFTTRYKSVLALTCQNHLYFGRFPPGNFHSIFCAQLADLSSYPLHILAFSLILKGFNFRQGFFFALCFLGSFYDAMFADRICGLHFPGEQAGRIEGIFFFFFFYNKFK